MKMLSSREVCHQGGEQPFRPLFFSALSSLLNVCLPCVVIWFSIFVWLLPLFLWLFGFPSVFVGFSPFVLLFDDLFGLELSR